MTKRIEYIDIARGLGILLVVLAHNDLGSVAPFAYKVIYSFHMPLFFFLSGYFMDISSGFWDFVKKRFHVILKPYLFTIFLLYFFSVSFGQMSFQTALVRIVKSLYGTGYYIEWEQLWFLPHLFAAGLYAYFFAVSTGKITNRYLKWLILLGTLGGASLVLARFYPYAFHIFGREYKLFGLPFSLDLVLLSGFFFILGGELRRLVSAEMLENLFWLAGAGSGLILANYLIEARADFSARVYQSFPINTLEAILGIFLVLALSRQIELRTEKLSALLSYLGRISLIILIFHLAIQNSWGQKILNLTGNRPFSIVIGFLMGVGGSILIYELFIKTNPVASFWFGRKAELPEQEPSAPQQ